MKLFAILAAAALVGGLSACSGLPGVSDEAIQPDLETDKVARMSAQNRYETAIGCASIARLSGRAQDAEVLRGFGMPEADLTTAVAEFQALGAEPQRILTTASAEAQEAASLLGKEEGEADRLMAEDYTRLETAFAGLASTQPHIAAPIAV